MTSEWLFPLTAIVLTWLVLMPVATVLCASLLSWRRAHTRVWADVGSPTTTALLITPTLLPLCWLISSACHLVESYPVLDSCLLDTGDCHEALLLSGLIVVMGLSASISRLIRHAPLHVNPLAPHHPLHTRIRHLCAAHDSLRTLQVNVLSQSKTPVFTTGLLSPRVFLDACFVEHADDLMLVSVLHHEQGHVRHRDGLWHACVKWCLALNPARSWLMPEYGHWRQAIEARRDDHALDQGADPLALAQGLVHAAKFECGSSHTCSSLFGLTASCHLTTLKLRLSLLLDGGQPVSTSRGHVGLITLLIGVIVLPHLSDSSILDLLHVHIERVYDLF